MQRASKSTRIAELVGHAAIGAGLGVFLSLTLIISDTGHIFEMIVNSSNPKVIILLVVGMFSSMLAVGATLTGIIFSAIEES